MLGGVRSAVLWAGLFLFVSEAYAATCDDYPFFDGIEFHQRQEGGMLYATSSVELHVNGGPAMTANAVLTATVLAKAQIAKFLNEIILSKEVVILNDIVRSERSRDTASQTRKLNTEIQTLIRSNASQMLKGVVKVGDCITHGEVVKVTVGVPAN